MSQTQQDSQRPTEETPSDLQTDEPRTFVVDLDNERFIFGNDPKRSLISHTALNSLLSEIYLSGNESQSSEGLSCDAPWCGGKHTQKELDLQSYVKSGRISFDHRVTRFLDPRLYSQSDVLSLLQASVINSTLYRNDPKEGTEANVAEEANSENQEQISAKDPGFSAMRPGSSGETL